MSSHMRDPAEWHNAEAKQVPNSTRTTIYRERFALVIPLASKQTRSAWFLNMQR